MENARQREGLPQLHILHCLFLSQFVLVLGLPMKRLGTRRFHPDLAEIFDADCSHLGLLETPFLSSNICTGLLHFRR